MELYKSCQLVIRFFLNVLLTLCVFMSTAVDFYVCVPNWKMHILKGKILDHLYICIP